MVSTPHKPHRTLDRRSPLRTGSGTSAGSSPAEWSGPALLGERGVRVRPDLAYCASCPASRVVICSLMTETPALTWAIPAAALSPAVLADAASSPRPRSADVMARLSPSSAPSSATRMEMRWFATYDFFSYRKWYGMPQAAVESGRWAYRFCAFGHHTVFHRSAIRASTRRFLARTSGPAGETDGGSPQPRSDVAVRLLCPEAPGLVTRRMGEVAFACHSYTAKKMASASGIRRNSASAPPGTRTFSQPACCYPH